MEPLCHGSGAPEPAAAAFSADQHERPSGAKAAGARALSVRGSEDSHLDCAAAQGRSGGTARSSRPASSRPSSAGRSRRARSARLSVPQGRAGTWQGRHDRRPRWLRELARPPLLARPPPKPTSLPSRRARWAGWALRAPATTSGAPHDVDEPANHDDDGDHDGHDRDGGGGKDHGRECSERNCVTRRTGARDLARSATLDQCGSKGHRVYGLHHVEVCKVSAERGSGASGEPHVQFVSRGPTVAGFMPAVCSRSSRSRGGPPCQSRHSAVASSRS
jgi:hypothetical protein